MPDPGVNIKVAVTGVEQAKQGLGDVGNTVQQAGTAAAGSQNKLADTTRKGAEAQVDFDRKAQSVVRQIAGSLSPELASAAGFALDLAEGFGKITPQMLMIGGTGAAIAAAIGVVASKLSDVAREARDAERALRDFHAAQQNLRNESLDRGAKLESELNKLGQFGRGPEAAALSERLTRERLVPSELADRVAIAASARVGGIPLTDWDMESLAAGLLTSAAPEFSGDPDADWLTVEALLNRGMEQPRRQALNAHRVAMFHQTLREANFGGGAPGGSDIDTAIERMKRAGVMSPEEEEVARSILEGGKDASFFRTWMQFLRREAAGDANDVVPAGSNETVGNIVGGVELARQAIQARRNTSSGDWPGVSPILVAPDRDPEAAAKTVIKQQTIINTNAVYTGGRRPRSVQDVGQLQAEWE